MANNKVQLGDGTVLVDMTDATASADKIVSGYTAYGSDGTKITGTADNAFIVTLYYNATTERWEPNETYTEISAAHTSGKTIVVDCATGDVTVDGTWETSPDPKFVYATRVQLGSNEEYFIEEQYYSYTSSGITLDYSYTYVDTSTASLNSGDQLLSGVTAYANNTKYTGTIPTKTSSDLTVSGPTVTAPSGYYAADASATIASGSIATAANQSVAPNINLSVNSSGLITASVNASPMVYPEVITDGYVSSQTSVTGRAVSISSSKTQQLTTQAATTITPTTSSQTAVAAGKYTTGAVTVAPIPSNYIIPTGSQIITENGTYDVTSHAQVEVAVSPDWTGATAEAEDVLHGKTFYGSDGSLTTGIASSVTGQIYQDEDGYIVLDDDGSYKGDRWVRPSEWMPYAKGWSKSSFEGIYYVYDLALNTDENNPRFWALYLKTTVNTGAANIETGYTNQNGVFIAETSESWTPGNAGSKKSGLLPYWDETNDDDYERYFVIRVTPQEGHHISIINFAVPDASLFSDLYGTITLQNGASENQPCIEQYGRLPYLTRISMASAYQHNHVKTMKHSYLIDVGKGGNLTTLDQAFRYNYGLECIDGLETWDVSNVTNFQYMFATCLPLKYIEGLDDWDLSNATTLARMFNDCRSLVTVGGLKDKDVESVTTIDNMFAGCYSLESLDLSGMSFSSSLTNINSAFYNCQSLKRIDISDWNISPTNPSYLFQNCNSLQSVDISGVNLSAATTIRAMFQSCYSLFDIKFGTGTTSSLTTAQDFISGASTIRKLDFTGWVFTNVTNSAGFANLYELVSLKGLSVPTSFNISASTMLNTDALVVILTALPIVATTQTITLGTTLKGRLSAEQLAIATEKGWTVA